MQKRRRILSIFFIFMVISSGFFSLNSYMLKNTDLKENTQENDINSSDVSYEPSKYPASTWWDTRFRFRTGLVIENKYDYDRFEPVNVYLTFEDGEHYEDSGRLVIYNFTGSEDWSDEIPVQVWNISYYSANYISSCTITFLVNISANSNCTYFFYYNENLDGIGIPNYNTDFSSILAGGKLTVTVGSSGDIYKAVLQEGMGVSELIKDTFDFHSDNSLSPEKQLSHDSLSFLAHLDENSGLYSYDSSGNIGPGSLENGVEWTDGIVKSGVLFDNNWINYGGVLDSPGDPFSSGNNEFTITLWLNPTDLVPGTHSNHYTYNCFMAKAHDSINDNFEAGFDPNGRIHLYIHTNGANGYTDIGNIGDVVVGQWNFIAIRFDNGDVDVRINDNWYSTSYWSSGDYLAAAAGATFSLGTTDHTNNVFFNGAMDEVAIYNSALTNEEVDEYKYCTETSTIESIIELENGEVFSQYLINWTDSFDMHVSDIFTFYNEYNLWNLDRTIYFDDQFRGNETNSQMVALNTYYDLSDLADSENFDYYYDNIHQDDFEDDDFTFENYTIIHDTIHSATQNAVGIFIANVDVFGAASDLNYFNGTVTYDSISDLVNFYSGDNNDFYNNIGGYGNRLKIQYWEYVDNVYDKSGFLATINNTLDLLRTELDYYIYQKDSKFYNLKVEVKDIDDNIVPDATVNVWNSSDLSEEWIQNTGSDGSTTFTRLKEGDYIVNVSYQKYIQPISITMSKIINLNEATTDSTGLNITTFENVQMTSLNLTLNRFNSTGDPKGFLEGASVTFWNESETSVEEIGSENSDEFGNVIFRWANSSLGGDNITFTVTWFDTLPIEIIAPGDLDPLDGLNVTYPFYTAASAVVNVTFGSSFETNITMITIPDGSEILGDDLTYQLQYVKIENGTQTTNLDGASATFIIKRGSLIITPTPIAFIPVGEGTGLYGITIDTDNPIGLENWRSSTSYTIEISVSKAGHITQVYSESIVLLDKPSSLTSNTTALVAYYEEYLYVDVTFTDITGGGSVPLEDALVTYVIPSKPYIAGSLPYTGSGGIYRLALDTTEFPKSGSYSISIEATQQNFESKNIILDISILAVKTYINGTIPKTYLPEIQYGDSKLFYFTYTIAESGLGLEDCEKRSYEWVYEVGGIDVDSGTGSLVDEGNGLYSLDFNTASRAIGIYHISCTLEKENYATRNPVILLTVNPREFYAPLPSDQFKNNIIQATSGKSLTFILDLSDNETLSVINDATLTLSLGGNIYDGVNNGDGTYTFTITKLPDAFFTSQAIGGTIYISRTNYNTKAIDITINVGMIEIFPGFPMFYFLMIVIGVGAVVGSLVTYRYIQVARIPTFIKKAKSIQKEIKGRKSISDKYLYPSKEGFIAKRYEDYWEEIGLDLEDILNLDKKKLKKIQINKNEDGGAN
ncbi:MAG: LamG domain-containing protein [Candidatus Lokiarchaeota archaeon]|nr:LamG domain-containing protein [Candidatus Lokiarchaeota archaeon]